MELAASAPLRSGIRRARGGRSTGSFPPAWNPLLNLGALGFFFFWIVTVSGIYLYIFFDTGITQAFESVEYMTHDQWYAAGVMRSFHRYASDGLVVVDAAASAARIRLDRYRGVRWFSWITGMPVTGAALSSRASPATGWSGTSSRSIVAIVSTEWLDGCRSSGSRSRAISCPPTRWTAASSR